jgi:dolichol-phosphate mannosyltransferase
VIYYCLPTYNEEQTIGLTLYKIKEVMEGINKNFKVITLDDLSTDNTWDTIQTYGKLLPITPIRNERRMGLGYCLKRLIQVVTDDSKYPGRDIMITVEADFTSDPGAVPVMIRSIEEGNDVVIASGFAKGGEVREAPTRVKLASTFLHFLLRNLYAIDDIRDYLSMFRAYRVTAIKDLELKLEDDTLDFKTKTANTELLIRLSGRSYRISEVPCVQRYDVRERQSRMKPMEMMKSHIRLVSQHWSKREE